MNSLDSPPAALDNTAVVAERPLPTFKAVWSRVTTADCVLLGLLVVLFAPLFLRLYKEWMIPEAPQAYGLLVLPSALALVWLIRARLEGTVVRPDNRGLLPVAFGLLLLFFGTLIVQLSIATLGFVCIVGSVVLARYGPALAKKLLFPILFLLALVPLPHEMMNMMTFQLQQISVRWASLLLRVFGEIHVEGTRITMPNYVLDVIAPCSGMTIILPMMVLALYYIYLITAPVWKKTLLFLLTIPIALVVNAVRVALIGVAGETYGPKVAEVFHDYSGIITVVCGFATLIFIAQELKCNHISDEIAL